MDIAAASTGIQLSNVQAKVGVSILKKVMNMQQDLATNLIEKQAELSQQIQNSATHQSRRIDVRV